MLKIHLDGGDDYLDCDLLICCTTVWLDATDARVSPLRRGARHVPLWWVEAYWQDDRPSCDDGSDTIDNPGSINPWFDSYADTAAYVESTRREWICLLNCALQNTGNAIGQLAQFNADGTRRPHAAKSRVRTIMLDNRVYRVAM